MAKKKLPKLCGATSNAKRSYRTFDEADAALGSIWARPRPGRRLECRVYQCASCGRFHLTKQPVLTPLPPRPKSA